ncbi:MAG: DUF1499 domain-containing protein [Gemmataceae bacterium]
MKRRTFYIILAILLVLACGGLAVLSFFSSKPDSLGLRDGKLAACPDSPNCVSSQASDPEHGMAPIPFADSPQDAMRRLKAALAAEPRTLIVTQEGNYLHAEATSLVFRFVDDVEFYVDAEAKVIQFRSASRAGRSDLGVNRARMERISARMKQAD